MNTYIEFDGDTFSGKLVRHCCDDPEWSDFATIFAMNFVGCSTEESVSSSHAPDSNLAGLLDADTLFETVGAQVSATRTPARGKKFTHSFNGINGDGVVETLTADGVMPNVIEDVSRQCEVQHHTEISAVEHEKYENLDAPHDCF